jgi:hypothetical protein
VPTILALISLGKRSSTGVQDTTPHNRMTTTNEYGFAIKDKSNVRKIKLNKYHILESILQISRKYCFFLYLP